MSATTKSRHPGPNRSGSRRNWTYYLERDFTQESVQLVCVPAPPKQGEPAFPEAVMFKPAKTDAARYRGQMDLKPNQRPLIWPTAGFHAKPGNVYPCLVSGRARHVLAFPANYLALEGQEWRPEPVVLAETLEFVKDEQGRWRTRHPQTGQWIYNYDVEFKATGQAPVLDPRTRKPRIDEAGNPVMTDVARVDMSKYMIRPVHTQGRWYVGKPDTMKKATPHDLVSYDERAAIEARLSITKNAPTFDIFDAGDAVDGMTIIEVFGSPIGPMSKPATSLEELADLIFRWLQGIREKFLQTRLMAATHPDKFPADWTPSERLRAEQIAARTRQEAELMGQWAGRYFQYSISYLAARRAAGKTIGGFRIPEPQGRKHRSTTPLAELTIEELREKFFAAVRPPKPKPEKVEAKDKPKKDAPAAAKPARSAKRSRTEPRVPHVEPAERTVLTTGDAPNTAIADGLKGVGLVQEVPEATPEVAPDDNGSKKRAHYFGLSDCEHHKPIRTPDPDLEGKVIPGTLCKKCAKNHRHNNSSRDEE